MAFVFLVPAEYLLAEVVVADLADELGLHAEPADGHARVRHGPAADDHALAHVDHLPGHEDIGHLVDLAIDRERRDEVQAGMARRHDFQVPIGRHSQPLVKRVRARQARTTICARPATLSHPLRSKYAFVCCRRKGTASEEARANCLRTVCGGTRGATPRAAEPPEGQPNSCRKGLSNILKRSPTGRRRCAEDVAKRAMDSDNRQRTEKRKPGPPARQPRWRGGWPAIWRWGWGCTPVLCPTAHLG